MQKYDILPIYCAKNKVEGRTLHEVIPAPEDLSGISANIPLSDGLISKLKKAREHVLYYSQPEVLQ